MTAEDILAHKALASSMTEWQIAETIKEINKEKQELSSFFSKIFLMKYDSLLNVYVEELEFISKLTNRKYLKNIH